MKNQLITGIILILMFSANSQSKALYDREGKYDEHFAPYAAGIKHHNTHPSPLMHSSLLPAWHGIQLKHGHTCLDHIDIKKGTPQDTTKKKKKPDYEIDRKSNFKSVQVFRRREGNRVLIHFRRMRSIPEQTSYVYFLASSGIKYTDKKPIEIREVDFPFQARLRFKALNQTQTQVDFYTLHFTIHKPGFWEVIMDF